LSISGSGKTPSYTGPTSVAGGTVQLSLHNTANAPHSAQLIRVAPPHTAAEALEIIAGSSSKVPNWIRAEGGLGAVAPGTVGKAIVKLTPGKYVVADVGGPGSGGPPAQKSFTVTAGAAGSLPSTAATVAATTAGKDKYKWRISGTLKPGQNTVRFESKGADALHLIAAARITGNPSRAQLIKALSSNGRPPSFVDTRSFTSTAVIDGGKSQITPLDLAKPGRYVLFCPLTDRDGGKPHFAEGLLTTVTVK
jgi:autotransporter-associated beta strand protein